MMVLVGLFPEVVVNGFSRSDGFEGFANALPNDVDLKIKMLEARLKMLETRLEMERHPKDHTCQSAAMLHELLNDMENLRME
ncbi:hypothetical protein Tco_0209887 [Tanacetum coccineum]